MTVPERIVIEAENRYGEKLELTNLRNGLWIQKDIKGIRGSAQVNSADRLGGGKEVVSVQFPERTIVLSLSVRSWKAREALDRIFRPGEETSFFFSSQGKRRKIKGIVLDVGDYEPDRVPAAVQVSLFCPDGYFRSLSDVWGYIARIAPSWSFPSSLPRAKAFAFSQVTPSLISEIPNYGDVEVGAVWEIRARAALSQPRITNINTYESMTVEQDLLAGDLLSIDTSQGLSVLLERNGQKTDVVNWFTGDFLTLRPFPEKNEFRYSALENERNMEIRWTFSPKYRTL